MHILYFASRYRNNVIFVTYKRVAKTKTKLLFGPVSGLDKLE